MRAGCEGTAFHTRPGLFLTGLVPGYAVSG
jgi:hypothetical protein